MTFSSVYCPVVSGLQPGGDHPWLWLLGLGVGAGVWLVGGGGGGVPPDIREPNSPPGISPVTREECTNRIE